MKPILNDIELFFYDWYLLHIKKPHCSLCGQVATLRNDNGTWICDDCAEFMNDLGIEHDIEEEHK